MSYGLQIENPSGGLVLSSDGVAMNYLGKATYVQDETAPALNGLYGGTFLTIKRYRITTASEFVLPFLGLTSANACGVMKYEKGNGYWDFVVFNQSLSNVCQPLDIYCFGRPTASSSWGMNLYDSSGKLAMTIGTTRLLMFSGVVDFPLNSTSRTIPSLTTPAVLGFSSGFTDPAWFLVDAFQGEWRSDGFVRGFYLSASTTLSLRDIRYRIGASEFFEVGTSPGNDAYNPPFTAYLIDANGLT